MRYANTLSYTLPTGRTAVRTTVRTTGQLVLGVAILSAASHVSVPLFPVPMTMQTLAVAMIGVLYGWRMGSATTMAWLMAAAYGLPVLAGGKFGLAPFVGPTAGYLYAFPLCAAVAGWIAAGKTGTAIRCFAAMAAANALALAGGLAWLAPQIGFESAIALGVLPFALGEGLKAIIGTVLLQLTKKA